jgi:ribosome maturation factor RimP
VTVEECARFSRALDPILDVEGELEGRYHLEISSPGLNRPLVKPGHFREHIGEIVQVTAEPGVGERKNFKGVIQGVEGEGEEALIKIKVDQTEFAIPWQNIKRAYLDYFATKELMEK